MSYYEKDGHKPSDPCKSQLFKTVKYRYYRYPTKYICTPVEWGIKCEKYVVWEPQKPYPPVKIPCEKLRPPYYKDEKETYGHDQKYYPKDGSGYETDGYANGDDGGDYEAYGREDD